MTAPPSIDLSGWLTEQLGQPSPALVESGRNWALTNPSRSAHSDDPVCVVGR